MMRFRQPLEIVLILFLVLVFLLLGCMPEMPRMTVKETTHYKVYESIELLAAKEFRVWTKTDIYIPKGAIVAVMAKGEVWDTSKPSGKGLQPYQCLWFKIGQNGLKIHIGSGIDLKNPSNSYVILSGDGGLLYFGMATQLPYKHGDPREDRDKMGKFSVRVIVWEKGHQDRIEGDILELIRFHPDDQQFHDLVAHMAVCFDNMGEYQKVQNLHKMMRENPDLDWDRASPIVLNMLANFEASLGRYDRGKIYLEEALKGVRRYGNRQRESLVLQRLAWAASMQKQYGEANLLLEESLKIATSINRPDTIGSCLSNIGQNLLRMNKPVEAKEHLEKALQQFYRGIRHSNRQLLRCYLSLGECYTRLNRNIEAKKSFESAIEMAVKIGDPRAQWIAQSELGGVAEKEGDDQKAFEHYAEAIKILESMRAKFTDPELKSLFMRGKFRVYEQMIQLLYRMQRSGEALHYLERARARVMLDMLAEKAFSSKNKEENELLFEEQTLRKRMEETYMAQEEISFEESQGQVEAISELVRLQAQHRTILERIEKRNAELASLVTVNPLKASEIQGLLDTDTAILEYFVGEDNQFVFVVTREKVLTVPLKLGSRSLFEKIKEFRVRAVEGITLDRLLSKVYEKPLFELYEILIQPIERELPGKKHLVIVPHGMLHYLPFQALLSKEGKYLIEPFTISYLPSASVLKYARAKNRGNRVDLFAAGNPSTELSPLPAAEVEVKEVSTIFEKKLVLTGRQATKSSVKGQSPKYDMVLLSTHGEMIDSDPLKSNLRFTPLEKDDGKLTVSEIFDMEIKANLVTLSACETALVKGEAGDFPRGDDLVGLSRAFIHAGAPTVLASLWKVSDDSTVKLMKSFYQNMKRMSKAEALRQAQIDLMRSTVRFTVTRAGGGMIQPAQNPSEEVIECSHPFFWAPFVLVGDWR